MSQDAFLEMVAPLRRELTAHCYRMVGSVHDAEDLVQETYLRAWRAFHGFENRSSVRTWMYRIATNTCLTALEARQRRPLPTGLGGPTEDPAGTLRTAEVPWLEPAPDALVWPGAAPQDPAALATQRDSIRLAFVAALQHLTAQQRAVLVLRDVLAWQASEVAEALGISVAAVNSTLQRARAHVASLDTDADVPVLDEDDPRMRALLTAYVDAFERYDVDRIVKLLRADAVWEMPPFLDWFVGAPQIGRLISTQCPANGPGDMRLAVTRVNGRPAVAVWMRDADGVHRPFQIQHLVATADGVARVTAWFGGAELFARFGLPEHPDGATGDPAEAAVDVVGPLTGGLSTAV